MSPPPPPGYLLLGLLCVLVLMETCHQLPQAQRLSHRFCQQSASELDPETTNILEQAHLSDPSSHPPGDSSHLLMLRHAAVIPSVSEQAAALRQDGAAAADGGGR